MKRILLDLGRSARRRERFAIALGLARASGAELRCVYAIPPVRLAVPSMSMTLGEQRVAEVLAEPVARLEAARSAYDAMGSGCGVSTSWGESTLPAAQLVVGEARYADLAVIESPADDGLSNRDVFDIVTGCPGGVLVLPDSAGADHDLGSVLVAWNGSREAARAVHEALPVLRRAGRVTVVSADESPFGRHDAASVDRLVEHLGLHGVRAGVHPLEAAPQHMGRALLDTAGELGAGLIVMGAFGHSRTFEFWLGGATRDALTAAALPLLMAS